MSHHKTNTSSGPASPPRLAQPSSADEVKLLKNRPNPSKLRQQRLPAWQPILNAYTAIPIVFAIGIVFIPIGIILLLASQSVKEKSVEYDTQCRGMKYCTIDIKIDEAFKGNVYFYYGLENFYQNHRRYVKSRSDRQLMGDVKNVADCKDLLDYTNTSNGKLPIAPCGAIANSMFNDTFKLTDPSDLPVPLTHDGVIWEIDRDVRFKNPPGSGQNLCDAFVGTAKPPNWQKRPCELDPLHPENNGFENVDFIVWMRTAALPTFRKLYRLLDRNANNRYTNGLPAGTYKLAIENNYPVEMFKGKKSFIIATTTWAGGQNMFLGIAYIVIGSICVILGAVFSFIHVKFGHSFAEMADITTNTR